MGEIVLNSKYSPGITTYGIPGEKGEEGKNGISMFFVPFNVENNEETLLGYINNNKIIGLEGEKSIDYIYQNGDTFVQPDGQVYQYYNGIFKSIGAFNLSSKQPFESNDNNVIYNVNNSNVVISNKEDIENNNYSLSIVNNPNSNSEEVNFIKIQNDEKYLTLDYNNDISCFIIKNNSPIVTDSLVIKGENRDTIIKDKYYYEVLSEDEIKKLFSPIEDNVSNLIGKPGDSSVFLQEGFSENVETGGTVFYITFGMPKTIYTKYINENKYFYIFTYFIKGLKNKEIILNDLEIYEKENDDNVYWRISILENKDEKINCELNIFDTKSFYNYKIFYNDISTYYIFDEPIEKSI